MTGRLIQAAKSAYQGRANKRRIPDKILFVTALPKKELRKKYGAMEAVKS